MNEFGYLAVLFKYNNTFTDTQNVICNFMKSNILLPQA